MKKFLHFFLIIMIISILLGCERSTEEFAEPVKFYYKAIIDFPAGKTDVFSYEVREGKYYNCDYILLLNDYLRGPQDDSLISPFPAGLHVVDISWEDEESISIVLSSEVNQLTALDQTIAFSGITQTLAELVACNNIKFLVEDQNHEVIIITSMHVNSVHLYDSMIPKD